MIRSSKIIKRVMNSRAKFWMRLQMVKYIEALNLNLNSNKLVRWKSIRKDNVWMRFYTLTNIDLYVKRWIKWLGFEIQYLQFLLKAKPDCGSICIKPVKFSCSKWSNWEPRLFFLFVEKRAWMSWNEFIRGSTIIIWWKMKERNVILNQIL